MYSKLGQWILAALLACQVMSAGAQKDMVRVPAGTNSGEDPEYGAYSITVDYPFHMDATEVTWEFWCEVRDWAITNGYAELEGVGLAKGDDHPVYNVSWIDTLKWCNARSEKEGLTPCYQVGGVVSRRAGGSPDCSFAASGYRLPTHVEWEYAARGGLKSHSFPWGDTITHTNANYFSCGNSTNDLSETRGSHPQYKVGTFPFTAPVASFPPNEYGLYDMAGNLWEWCWAPKGASRTFRGGSWDADAKGVSCGYRSDNSGNGEESVFGGFRCVRRAGQ